MSQLHVVDDLWNDLVYAARQARNSPGFTAVAVLSLALGISANTTIFSAINAVLVRPLPYPNSDRLVGVFNTRLKNPAMRGSVSMADVQSWKKDNRVLDRIEYVGSPSMTVRRTIS
jgi:putative ABC transport system permease protein